ncbi:MAG: hypothetical protein COT38_05755 [Candidatus Omnitrophica bacterium CG08_land_8_20_14_0_20_41_16]|uniref:Uncharacterized protein n=1 Tax=Candidatus Sherwoodlollariibacterium unditelluris TaxID=1974757 RepID=A0A2G9YJQ1_9BACT|nr:MAG: hypothetical protein COX41_02765 [Candidatus Omnitrophica bacterium CG23_combo_of_CG06-09_8_20_14_all_41_10]PIS33357.1 MAG: hypothetical protein COT38_05755 [Candidatus Omnitrophica bacterium CG08_land_8_20_14_0_20_41_16]
MRKYLGFLKVSSLAVKIAAWIFLFLGVLSGIATILNKVPGYPWWMGVIILGVYAFLFFFFYLIAKIADLLTKIINEIKKE